MKLIGLTGGIGTGKSTVAKYYKSWGCHIIEADILGKTAVLKGSKGLFQIKSVFGNKYIDSKGELDRQAMADLVFNNQKAILKLNEITHPIIKNLFQSEVNKIVAQNSKSVIIYDVALLFEEKIDKRMQKCIVVYSDEKLQIQRLINKRGLNHQDGTARIKIQIPQSEKINRADFLIPNNGDFQSLEIKAFAVYNEILKIPHI